MLKTFRYRIYPTKRQERLLSEALEECRWLYNHLLEQRRKLYEQTGQGISCFDQIKQLPILKRERPSLEHVNAQVLQQVVVRLDLAFQAFFRRVKAGEKPGYPRFKGQGRYKSLTYPQVPKGCTIRDGKLVLSKIGHIKIVLHRPLRGKLKTCTVFRSATGKWYASFSCECEPKRLPPHPHAVGIDLGLKHFAALSDGKTIETPAFFRREEKALAKAQRRLSRLGKDDPERPRRKKIVARIHERIRFRRDNFTHQQSRRIVDRYGFICVEDLVVSRMVHHPHLAKSIQDAAWSEFLAKLSSKAEEAGRQLVKVNPAYTSQTCSACGHRQAMPLEERVFACPCCGIVLDRDVNAARNILALGRQGWEPEKPTA
ncbi:MAG: transposase [Thermogemmatispora sp.]|uniref:RNA-guided endonuclease InsQ/TnpB family protein n=1 Tax=Thermogemmatispora sp. TaxID=1968838 RepID=UPI0026053310|nr:transposase [Thermogemmatispora sp.]MBX5457789.1 transposase [Thermogemmatispora sp.]